MAENTCTVESVLETSNYFSSLVELIPARFYLQNDEKQVNGYKNKKTLSKADKKLLAKKSKLLRLDPSQHKSIEELQAEIEKKEKEQLEEDDSTEILKPIKVSEVTSVPLDELREKLHAKLEEIRGKRKFTSGDDEKAGIKKARIERKDKKKKKTVNGKVSSNIKIATGTEAKSAQGSIKNDRGEIVFSKFDFATGNVAGTKKPKKDVKKLLEKAEKTKIKVELLEEEDTTKAKELKDKMAWEKALKKAEGQKLRDDPKLLKKTIKRKEKMKSHSQKKWKDRQETVEKQKQEKQDKRAQNIKERKEERLKKKTGKGNKKKKSKPGF